MSLLEAELEPGILCWTISNPERRNAITPEALHWIRQRCSELHGEIVVLRGQQPGGFCAGYDLTRLQTDDANTLPDAPLVGATEAMLAAEATFVAQVDCYAIGAGVELMCTCDIRLAASDAFLAVPVGRVGVVYHARGLLRMRAVLGDAATSRLVLLGERISVDDPALASVFVRRPPSHALSQASIEAAKALRASADSSLAAHRALLRTVADGPVRPSSLQRYQDLRTQAYAGYRYGTRSRVLLDSPPMSIREQIDTTFRQARVERDERTKNVISMLKNKVLTELKSGKGVEETDALWQSVLESYAKQVRKSIPELEKAGERGQQAIEDARFELEFCERFLPQKLDEQQTEALVRRVVHEHGIDDPKHMGKLMGLLMKEHRDQLDGETTRRVAQRVLAER